MTVIVEVFDTLKASATPMTWLEVTSTIASKRFVHGGTVSRALRRLFAKKCVTREFLPGKHSGTKLWSAIPNAVYTVKQRPAKVATPKKSSGKVTVMALPTNKPTLVTATLQAITVLMADKKTFSAHDVTKKLRDMVKDGSATVDHTETGVVHVGGKAVARIEHDEVRGLVHEYHAAGKMDGYDKVMNGDHWEYAVLQTLPTPPVVIPTPMPPDDYNGDPAL